MLKKWIGIICMTLSLLFFTTACDDFFSPVIQVFIEDENQNTRTKKKEEVNINEENF